MEGTATFDAVVALRAEGVSISAVARIERLAWNTVARWLEKAADVCRGFNQRRTVPDSVSRSSRPAKFAPSPAATGVIVWSGAPRTIIVEDGE